MKLSMSAALVLTLALTSCTAGPGGMLGAQVADSGGKGNLASAASQESMPFKTLIVDEGPGRWLAAGSDERTVLRGRADLDALLARHARYVQSATGPMRPTPGPSMGPPMMRPPDGVPMPSSSPEPLPEMLMNLDFARWQAIAFVDGAVDASTTSRITAVVDRGDRLEVRTTRWVAPPNPASGPSPSSRVHVVAIPRTDKPVTFAETAVLDGTAKPGEGGYGLAGGPIMNPKWKAVPNPELTREKVEEAFRGMLTGAKVTHFSVEKRTIEWVRANLYADAARMRYTPDSEVWVVVADGDLPMNGPGVATGPGLNIGAEAPRATRMWSLVSIEESFPVAFESASQPAPAEPGFSFEIEPQGDLYVGDTLRLTPRGKPVEGKVTLTLTLNGGAPVVREVSFAELATFALPLDRTTLPGLTEAPIHTLSIKADYQSGKQGGGTGRDVKLIRDRSAKPTPGMRVQGPGLAEEYRPAAGERAWDAFVRDIAATDWQGTGLSTTSRTVKYADFKPEAPYNFDLAPETSIRIYEVRGTFPTFIVPAVMSGQGVDEVMAPRRLVIAVTEQVPVIVVGLDAYAN
jgi:hypothetical protein